MNLKNIKVISFDAFDTIVTMTPNYWMGKVMQALNHERERTQAEVIKSTRRLVCENRTIVEDLLIQGLIHREQFSEIQALIHEEAASIRLVPGAKQLIERLSRKKFQIAIVSNLGYDYGKPMLDVVGHPVEYPVMSYEVGHRKPEPEIFGHLLGLSRVEPSEILHIGNSYKNDYRGALSVRFQAIHLDLKNESRAGHAVSSIAELSKMLK